MNKTHSIIYRHPIPQAYPCGSFVAYRISAPTSSCTSSMLPAEDCRASNRLTSDCNSLSASSSI
ncbi:unnamed protein product [Chondrus crispus]|uniref:Uncharacterized protein n=1 Tax=Chondrus crispus TaxID=2769 RepID=R7QPJ9_CHOCR|nr:unnamed protein product [Chondrus crispus]XP_005719322.1 unnamed protein product [Chondrus crispus]CDF36776.1 unnamed protein product [Chondrus crispus]CDF39411.1 unnamed protein product [Chondrus crispus]|eukprot:XP_005716595.1 unnamed protein product [Chondrus crispus]